MVQYLKLIKVKALFQLMLMMKKKSKEELELQKNCQSRKEELKLPKNCKSSFAMIKTKNQCLQTLCFKRIKILELSKSHSPNFSKELVQWEMMSLKKWSLIKRKQCSAWLKKNLKIGSLKTLKMVPVQFKVEECFIQGHFSWIL